jgi:hypothetical protein
MAFKRDSELSEQEELVIIQHKAEGQARSGMRLLIHPVAHELACSNLVLAARKLTASTKSTPRELRPIPYDLIGPTALRAHTSEIVCRGAGAAGLLDLRMSRFEERVTANVACSS